MAANATLPTLADALALGLTEHEYELVCEKQGGPPNVLELAMYSLLWSEHCAYKHSKKLLRTLPTDGPHVVMGPGESFNGSVEDIAGVCNETANVFGLMPHPEHAVDALTGGSLDGLKIFQSMRLALEAAPA